MTKGRIIIFSAAAFIFFSLSHAETPEQKTQILAIEDSIRIALKNNLSIQMQQAKIKEAMGNKLYALSNFLPKAGIDYDYTYHDAVLSTGYTPGLRKDTRIFQGYKSDNLLTFSVSQDFFKGGAYIADYKQAGLELLSERETYRAVVLEVEFETQRLFYGLILAYETERIARDLVAQADAHYQEVLAKFNQGTASRFDVLQSKVQVSRLMPQLINAGNAIKIIKEEFKKILVLDMRGDVSVRGALECEPIEIKERAFLTEAYAERPEMRLKSLGIDIEKWGIELAKSTGIPEASGNFGYTARSDNVSDMVNPHHDNWSIGVKVSVPIFDGLATPAKINEARAKYTHAKLDRDDYIDQIAVDVKQACVDLENAHAIVAAEKDTVVEAKEALRLAEVRYNTGVGINLDVFDSQVALAQIEQSLAQAMYDYRMAKADLYRIMGREFSKEE